MLRFRSPVPGEGLDDPADGVLAAVGIDSGLPTTRTSDRGIGLGAPQDQVLATYAGNLEDHSHPYTPGGHVFIAPVGQETGLAIAYLTDGVNRESDHRRRPGHRPLRGWLFMTIEP